MYLAGFVAQPLIKKSAIEEMYVHRPKVKKSVVPVTLNFPH